MPEFPDPNAGGLNPSAPPCKLPPGKRWRAYLILALALALFGGMAIAGGLWVCAAMRHGHTWIDRLFAILAAIGLIAPFAAGVRGYIRAKRRAGLTPESRRAYAQKVREQCTTGGCATQNNPMAYTIKWASYAAMQPSFAVWQRTAAWCILALYTATMLALTALGVIMIGAGFDGFSASGLGIAVVGAAALIWPFFAARALVRGIRSGKIGTTREEFDQLRAGQAAWRIQESRKPLRMKLLESAFCLAILILWWMHNDARHPGQHGNWISPAMMSPLLLYSLWTQFRAPSR